MIKRIELRGRIIEYTVNENGCYIPLLKPTVREYVRATFGGKQLLLHRVSFEEYYGIKADGVIMHKCDNPACFNPDHLSLGTQADNIRDAQLKGRMCRGSEKSNAKITEEQAKAIFLASGTCKEIAEKFGVSTSIVHGIKRRKNWRHVTEELGDPPKAKRGRPRKRS